ncbi:MAG TPA: permease, partial [Clostridia bacterium]|nr:permease [Clostridia bacterium]
MASIIGPLLVYLAAALAVILPGYGSAKVVGKLGQIASGIMAEDPGMFGKLLILQALPGTQGIYGLLGWFMIMNHSGM